MARAMRRRCRLSRRLGLSGRSPAVMACIALMVVLSIVGLSRVLSSQPGFDVMRYGEQIQSDDLHELSEGQEGEIDSPDKDVVQATTLMVHVDGAVENPGVYELDDEDVRVVDVVERAGGLAADADTSSINLAASVVDGQKIHIPREGEANPETTVVTTTSVDAGATLVNINVATAEELKALPGVGDSTAAAIIEERERGGPFTCPEDIMRVTGIGQKKFERMRDLIGV